MNKLKILYDVFRTMKEKEVLKGTLKVEGIRDQGRILSFSNTFEKNSKTGELKAKISSETDFDGKKFKMENSIDSNSATGCHGHHGFGHHGFGHHGVANAFHQEHFGSKPQGHMGIKGGLEKIAFVLGILNSLKVEERQEKSAVLTLDLNDIPEEIKNTLHERMKKAHGEGAGPHFMKEFHSMDKTCFRLNIYINGSSEIEKAELEFSGEGKDEKEAKHDMLLKAELCLMS